jgi:hypothetical protein
MQDMTPERKSDLILSALAILLFLLLMCIVLPDGHPDPARRPTFWQRLMNLIPAQWRP